MNADLDSRRAGQARLKDKVGFSKLLLSVAHNKYGQDDDYHNEHK